MGTERYGTKRPCIAARGVGSLVTRRALIRCGLWSVTLAAAGLPAAGAPASIAAAPASTGRKFAMFDGLLFRAKPDLRALGLEPIVAVAAIWRPGAPRNELDPVGLKAALKRLPRSTATLYIDVESWPLLTDDRAVRERSANNYLSTAEIIREALPDAHFGFYGVAPCCVYWPIVAQQSAGLDQWHAANESLLPLTEYVDFVLPSLYTFYDDQGGWAKFASASIAEARIYGKPVYPFLWNQYFDGNWLLKGRQVKADAWNAELELCFELADGAVLWGGSEQNWDPAASWWQSVKQLLRRAAPG